MADRFGTRGIRGSEEKDAGWGLGVALVALALLLAVAVWRREPPAPRPPQPAPTAAAGFSAGSASAFSGERAREVLRDLLADGAPHPLGSAPQAAMRDRIVARLRSLGYEPAVEQGVSCNRGGNTCGRIEDIVARLPGTQPTGAVLVMSHYDSVPAGPGAGDDMSGVASVLEIASLLKAGPPPKNTVLFMLEDGEEAGLLGARWFADHSPLAAEVKAVVNLEARGTSGPSLMFETSADNAWLVRLYAARAPHPVTSSVFAAIYDLMPNDTDLTVFKRRPQPVPGLNFAFVGHPAYYHTAADSLDHVSPASLQHHGDNALAALGGLTQADLASPPRGKLAFFDVLGAFVVGWPLPWSLPLALLALGLAVIAAVVAVRRGTATGGGVLLGLAAFLVTVLLAGVLGAGLFLVAPKVPWVAHPLPLVAVFWLLALAVAGFVAGGLGRRAGAAGLWAGAWLGWALLGLLFVVALPAPGASYLFVVPALVAAVAGLALLGRRGVEAAAGTVGVLLPAVVAAVLWFPIMMPLYDGLGAGALVPIAVLMSIFFTSVTPLFVTASPALRRSVPLAAAVVAVVCLVIAIVSPAYSPSSPQPQNLVLHQDADSGKARWIVAGPPPFPPVYRQVAAFSARPEAPFPWSPPGARSFVAPAPALGAPAPELAVLADSPAGGGRHLRLRLSSPRGASAAVLYIPAAAGLTSIKLDGAAAESPSPAAGWYRQTLLGIPPQGMELEVEVAAAAPLEWYVTDRTYGLPPAGDALRKARPAAAVAVQDGDLTVVSRKVKI